MALKEVMAIVRPNRMLAVKRALEELGFPSFTAMKVVGRGKQGGRLGELAYRVSKQLAERLSEETAYAFIPKRLLLVVVPEEMVEEVVARIMRAARTGAHGDGKIFVSPVEEALRVRTRDSGLEALF